MKAIRILFFLFLFFGFYPVHAITKGSESLCSVLANYEFPENVGLFGANQILGFAWFKNGFSLENSNTHLIFNAVFPVSGTVDLNGGTVTLQEDLVFQNGTTLQGLGTILGGGHTIKLCQSVTSFPDDDAIFQNAKIVLDNDITINSTIIFQGECELCGMGKVITLGQNGELIVDTDACLTFCNIGLNGLVADNVRCMDDTGGVIYDDVQLLQEDSVIFNKGMITFNDHVSLSGSSTFYYDSSQASIIKNGACFHINDGMKLSLGRDPETLNEPLIFEDESSCLHLENCSFIITEHGLQLTKGKITIVREVTIDVSGTTTQTGLIIGDGSAENDMTVWFAPGAAATHNLGYWVYNNSQKEFLKSSSKTARMIRNIGSKIYVAHDLELKDITVQLNSNYIDPIEVASGAQLTYSNASVVLPTIEFDITSDQLNPFTYILNGNDSIFITKGTLPLYLLIQNGSNSVIGNGSLTGLITLYDAQAQCTCGISGTLENNIMLNGGTFILGDHVRLGSGSNIFGPGTVNLSNKTVTFPTNAHSLSTPIYWIADDGGINVRGTVSLSTTWTVKGKCTLNGINSKFILDENAHIYVDTNSELVLENLRVYGVRDENIACVDDTGKITLKSAQFVQTGDTIFSHGSMEMHLKNSISGAYTFSYESVMTSTIKSDGQCIIKDGLNLIAGRNDGSEPIYMEDSSATVMFQDSALTVKDTGLLFTRGTFIADRDVVVDVMGTTSQTGLLFGDGIAEHDMSLILNPGATARFPRGFVQYDVTTPNGIRSKTHTAQLIRGAESHFNLKSNLNLADMTVDVHLLSDLTIDTGKTLSYSNGHIVLPQGTFDLTGVRYDEVTSLLAGNDKIVLVNGSMPLATLVAGTGNSIEGNGDVTGPIILSNSAAELTCNMNGTLLSAIVMNGGAINLTSDLYLANGVIFSGSGTISMANNNLELGKANLAWRDDIAWHMDGGSIGLHAFIDVSGTWTFNGDCTIKGRGNTINIGESGCLLIGSNSTLCLQDITLENISETNIGCVDDTGVLILDGVDCKQRGDTAYYFNNGALRIKNKVTIRGKSIFAYESSQTSTICRESQLKFDANMTFSYYPSNHNSSLLQMESGTAQLIFNNASLCTTVSGLHLVNGQCVIRGDCNIYTDSYEISDDDGITTKYQEGLVFGADNVDDDCGLFIAVGASCALREGKLDYRNVAATSLIMENRLSKLYLAAGTVLAFSRDIPLQVGHMIMHEKALLQSSNEAEIIGSVFVAHEN